MPDFTISSTQLPNTAFQGNLQQVLDLYAAHLVGTYNAGGYSVLRGVTGSTDPSAGNQGNQGLWVNGNVLYAYNQTYNKYLPFPVTIGRMYSGSLNLTSILSSATANRTLITPDNDGTIALLSDVYDGQPTATISGASPTVDWSIPNQNFYLILSSATTTINHINSKDGQVRHVWIESPPNPPTANTGWTVLHPNVAWPNGGTAPTQWLSDGATHRKIDHYKYWKVGGFIFGEFVQNYTITTDGAGGTVGGDTLAPTMTDASRNNINKSITLVMSELLQGGTLPTGDFRIYKQGALIPTTAASASGSKITLYTSTAMRDLDNITLTYAGSSIKDLAGNATVGFGPVVVNTYTVASVGGQGYGGSQNQP